LANLGQFITIYSCSTGGFEMGELIGQTSDKDTPGVLGESTQFEGVRGVSHAGFHGGVVGINDNTTNEAGPGVFGSSIATGVWGESKTWMGVFGKSQSTTGGAGVMGQGDPGPGVIGVSTNWIGVYGETSGIVNGPAGVWGEHKANGTGTVGKSVGGVGVFGISETNEGIHGETKSPRTAAIAGFNLNPTGTGAAIYGKKVGDVGHAGFFEGNVHVTGDITLANADCAEHFDIADTTLVEPGTVMVLGEEGALHPSRAAYDKRVAGVVSGAGEYKPAIVLDRQASNSNRQPIALLGKVYCKVDAQFGAVEIGDLLTTSPTQGYAMKADDPMKAFGAVIGKALRPLVEGQELIPILIALQ
jgi:hypothetical protein